MKLTKKQLMDMIKDLPDNYVVKCEHIEDVYFDEGKGWIEGATILPNDLFEDVEDIYYQASGVMVSDKRKEILICGHY